MFKYLFVVFLLFASAVGYAQEYAHSNTEELANEIRQRSAIWNSAFSARDTSKLLTLLADDVQMASAGGKWRTVAGSERFFKSLFERRPNITWINEPTEIKVNPTWDVAYEFGNWTEGWTESDGRAVIHGKYFALWKQTQGTWFLHALIFTPLTCTGPSSYCQKH